MNQGRAKSTSALRARALLELCVAAALLVALGTVFAVALAAVTGAVALEMPVLAAAAALDVRDITTAEPDATAELASTEAKDTKLVNKEGTAVAESTGGVTAVETEARGAGDSDWISEAVPEAKTGGGPKLLCVEAAGAGGWVV